MQIAFIILRLIIILLIWSMIEQKLLILSKYDVTSKELPQAFHQTKFIILSDLHNCTFGRNNKRLIKRIHAISPEFIVIAGDMIDKKELCHRGNTFSVLEHLTKQYQIYYAYGNHEQSMEVPCDPKNSYNDKQYESWVIFKKRLRDLGVIFLDNKSAYLRKEGDEIRITGLSLDKKYFEHGKKPDMEEGYLKHKIGKKKTGMFSLLIAHHPAYFKEYADWGADLTIAGHYHGGLVRIPGIGGMVSPQVKLFPKYSGGLFFHETKQMIVSRGLGSHSLMPRLFNIPEIVVVTMKYTQK